MITIRFDQVWQCSVRQTLDIDTARVRIASPDASRGIKALPYSFT